MAPAGRHQASAAYTGQPHDATQAVQTQFSARHLSILASSLTDRQRVLQRLGWPNAGRSYLALERTTAIFPHSRVSSPSSRRQWDICFFDRLLSRVLWRTQPGRGTACPRMSRNDEKFWRICLAPLGRIQLMIGCLTRLLLVHIYQFSFSIRIGWSE